MKTLIVGIDPAPSSKGNAVVTLDPNSVEGTIKIEMRSHSELRKDLQRWKTQYQRVLIAWDAPLTGPADPLSDACGDLEMEFTKRPIECYFSRRSGLKAPKGVSVQGYADCQHWTITRNLLGLPIVGPYDNPNPDYSLIARRPSIASSGHYVVEVHPALAMWLWLGDEKADRWKYADYKDDQREGTRRDLLEALLLVWKSDFGAGWTLNEERLKDAVKTGDTIDALVASALAYGWEKQAPGIDTFGDSRTGSFLVPCRGKLDEAPLANHTS